MVLIQTAKNKGADQTARMRRLVCAFVVRKPPKSGFLETRAKYISSDRAVSGVISHQVVVIGYVHIYHS